MLHGRWTCMCVKFQLFNFNNVCAMLKKLPKNINNLKRGVTDAKKLKIDNPRTRLLHIHQTNTYAKFEVPKLNNQYARPKII